MVSKRDRILSVINYLKTLGIEVNYGKNKARGNKGFFKVKLDKFRIDISKELTDDETLSVLVHEFAHYLHYLQDSNLKSLSFIIDEKNEILLEELLSITVDLIPKKTIKPLFELQETLKNEIDNLKKQRANLLSIIEINTKQKLLNRINSKIARMNRYYNSKTELFARSFEMYVLRPDMFRQKAPNLYFLYNNFINKNDVVLNFLSNYNI